MRDINVHLVIHVAKRLFEEAFVCFISSIQHIYPLSFSVYRLS